MIKQKKDSKFLKFIKSHKWTVGTCTGVLVIVLGVGGVAIAQENIKIANTQKAIDIAEEDGVIHQDTLDLLEENGGLADLGTEINNPDTGDTVVLEKDDSGNIVSTTTNNNGSSSGATQHVHVWTPITTVEHHDAQYSTEIIWLDPPGGYECNACGYVARTGEACSEHTATAGHGGWHSYQGKKEQVWHVVKEAYDETVVLGYYCSECGARQ